MNYAEEQLQHAIEKEKKGNNNMDKDYKSLWEDSIKENKELEEENTNLANEKYDLELEMGSLVKRNKQLEDNLISKEKCNNELKSKITDLEEIIDNYRKGIENSNVELAVLKGKEEKLKGEVANLKQLLKAVTYLL